MNTQIDSSSVQLLLLLFVFYLNVMQRKSLNWINFLENGPHPNINQNMKTLKHISKIANISILPKSFRIEEYAFEMLTQSVRSFFYGVTRLPSHFSLPHTLSLTHSVSIFISFSMQYSYKVISKWNQIIHQW